MFHLLTWSLRKKFNFSIIDISNSLCIQLENSLHKISLVTPNIISSTYISTINNSLFTFLISNVLSTWPLVKDCSIRKLLNLSYHDHGACFKPYKAFFQSVDMVKMFIVHKSWWLIYIHFFSNETIEEDALYIHLE